MRKDDVLLDNCLKCSDCNTACPVMTAHPAYPGPKRLGPELERMRREGIACDTDWLEYCLACHRCDLACPNSVNVSELIAKAKSAHKKPTIRAMRDWWFARPGLIGRLMTIAPGVGNLSMKLMPVRMLMSACGKITPERKFPAYTRARLRVPDAPASVSADHAERVVFFPGCAIRYNQPEIGCHALQLLQLNGFRTELSEAGCCGVPAMANGNADEARERAAANIHSLIGAVDAGARIVTACSSCGHMLKSGMVNLVEGDAELEEKASRISAATYDLAELLIAQQDSGKFNARFEPAATKLKLAYHAPCHQKSQGIGRPWYHLLRQVPGVEIEDLNAGCCGMSGTFGFKKEKYPVSMAVGSELFKAIGRRAPQVVVTECATCQMQIEHGTGVKAIHPVEILLNAYQDDARS